GAPSPAAYESPSEIITNWRVSAASVYAATRSMAAEEQTAVTNGRTSRAMVSLLERVTALRSAAFTLAIAIGGPDARGASSAVGRRNCPISAAAMASRRPDTINVDRADNQNR